MDNEVYLRGVLRSYRNALVEFIRDRLTAAFGDEAASELAKLFGKAENNGKTRWENLKLLATKARATPEVSTVVQDDFELLGVADFYSIFEKFYAQLFPASSQLEEPVWKEHRAGLLRCMRQIKVMRDPTSHEVTQDLGKDEFTLTASNVILALKACDKDPQADQVREMLTEVFSAKPSYSVCLVTEAQKPTPISTTLAAKLSASGVNVSTKELGFEASEETEVVTLPNCSNICPMFDRLPDPSSEVARALRGVGAKRNVVPLHNAELDALGWNELAGQIGVPSTSRIALHPEYLSEAATRLLNRLQPSKSAAPRGDFSSSVPVAKAVSDNRLINRLYDQLRQTELRTVALVSPFASNVSNWTLRSTTLVKLLAEQAERGASVTLITRPPSPTEGYDAKRQFLTMLASNGVNVLLNELLHAKIYLFESSGDRMRWFVGSHNLTANALTKLKEVSMEGFREPEYREVETAMVKIREDRMTRSFHLWTAQQARQGAPR